MPLPSEILPFPSPRRSALLNRRRHRGQNVAGADMARSASHAHIRRRHVLVTNDFPPKQGGIQNYLYEIYRRLPEQDIAVVTSAYPASEEFDRQAGFEIVRLPKRWLLPTPGLTKRITDILADMAPDSVALDPALPLGDLARKIGASCTLVVHGAEVVIPTRLPILRAWMTQVLRACDGIIASSQYTNSEFAKLPVSSGGRTLKSSIVPPGVDTARFFPADEALRRQLRARFGYGDDDFVVVGISRLVPRKGMDKLIEACAIAKADIPGLRLVIGGDGRERHRLERQASRAKLEVAFIGRVDDHEMVGLYQTGDLFAMLCRNRWFGLEQEGFGIVFLEAASCGIPQLAGNSGGAAEAVAHGVSGFVISNPKDATEVARRIVELAQNPELRETLGRQARQRAVRQFDYGLLATSYAAHFGL